MHRPLEYLAAQELHCHRLFRSDSTSYEVAKGHEVVNVMKHQPFEGVVGTVDSAFFSQAASPVVAQLRHYRFSTRCLKDTWPLALVASAEKRMPGTNAQATCAQQLELEPRVSKKSERTETPADNSSRSCTCEPHLAYPSLEPSDTKDAEASQRHPGREHTCP